MNGTQRNTNEKSYENHHQNSPESNGTPPVEAQMLCEPTNEQASNESQSTIVQYKECTLPEDVENIEEVEWASEDPENPSPSEYARRPRYASKEDPCGCTPAYDEETDTIDTRPCCTDTTCVLFACQEECRGNCEAGDLCGNKRVTKKQWKSVSVVDAGVKGRGLILNDSVNAGDFIIEYTGVAIQKSYLDSMFRRYRLERMLYIMALDNDVYIDARRKGSIARYVNHSCEPNCAVHRWKVRGISRACIFALKEVKAGEELSFDYKWKRKRGRAPTKCYCGYPSCRGTLEDMLDKSEEEEQEEMQLQGHWKAHTKPKGAGREIMNRTIKVITPEVGEDNIADVCKYDESIGQHCLIYRGEIEETWENLDEKEWLILDEEMEQYVITRKAKHQHSESSGLISTGANLNLDHVSDPIPRSQSPMRAKNYLILQTPMKEKLFAKHLVDRCQRHHRVQISVIQVLVVSASDPEEIADEEKALKDSQDGTSWKFTFTGLKPIEAREYIEKNIQDFIESDKRASSGIDDYRREEEKERSLTRHEIVIPRCVVDHVKNRMPLLRNNCKNAEITFTASKSMSKQFAKLIIESQDPSAASDAQRQLWKEVLTLCNVHDAPRTPKGLFKDLAFYGGEISKEEFDLLCPKLSTAHISQNCAVNLRESADMAGFEDLYRCTIWVQATEDMGRINSRNQLLTDARSEMRKIYFGTEPRRIPELWDLIKLRVRETKAGVKFLNMDAEKQFLLYISGAFERPNRLMPHTFFEYLKMVTKAAVTMDVFSQYVIRIDAVNPDLPPNQRPIFLDGLVHKKAVQAAKLVQEIVNLQLQLFRDTRIRRHRWGFGRDWSFLVQDDARTEAKIIQEKESVQSLTRGSHSYSPRPSHKRNIASACLDIAEITEALGLDGSIAAHACVILYRYLNQASEQIMNVSQSKQRDILLTCLFLANKAQKECKWKRLEGLLSCAYKIFYNGARFHPQTEEGSAWEKRILATEKEIVTALEYDIFWGGVDWIISTLCDAGVAEPIVKNVMELTLTGPVLAAGSVIWLKLGPEYAFTSMAALLQMDIELLLTPLSINSLKLADAIELVTNSISTNKTTRQKNTRSSHDVFRGNRETFLGVKKNVMELCKVHMDKVSSKPDSDTAAGQAKQYQIISNQYRQRRKLRGIQTAVLIRHLLPGFGKIRDRCSCDIFVEEDAGSGCESIILEGGWRSLAMAEHMLKEQAFQANLFLNEFENSELPQHKAVNVKARSQPGLVDVSSIESVEGWDDISDSEWKRKIGGKTCMPGKVNTPALQEAGLRWWLHPSYCPSSTGSICNMPELRKSFVDSSSTNDDHLKDLGKVAEFFDSISKKPQFPLLTSYAQDQFKDEYKEGKCTPVSLQRWPPKKTASKEQERGGMGVGVSPAALQEMQILTKVHSIIPGPQGHPNFILPIAIAIDPEEDDEKEEEPKEKSGKVNLMGGTAEDLLSSFFPNTDSLTSTKPKNSKMKGSYLVFQPTPIILQRVMNKNKKKKSDIASGFVVSPALLTAWFHDLLSAVDHCHRNHIVLRTIHPDQIFIDSSGVAKLSGLTRSIVLHPTDRDRYLDPLSSSKNKKKSGSVTDDDMASNPYMAPELLLGATRYSQQSDVWTLAALIAHLMIGKPIFSGRDRKSKTRAIFKIIGTPSTNNYKEAQSYPYYDKCKPDKKYKSGVGKALKYMFEDSGRDNPQDYAGVLSLLDKMLILDPRKRMNASDALESSSMTDYVEWTTTDEFRKTFVEDWKRLKESLCLEEEDGLSGGEMGTGIAHAYGNGSLPASGSNGTASYKRPVSYLDSSLGENDTDGLYDISDMMGRDDKRAKFS